VLNLSSAGLDFDHTGVPYEISIPIEKAADPHGDVLLGNTAAQFTVDSYPRRLQKRA
jgi:hypothetical protein